MKLLKILLSLVCAVAVLFAIPLAAFAIEFAAEEKYNSVFVVTSGISLGSGFAIGENCIVTNAHVINDIDNIILTTYAGETYTAYVIGCDQDRDIAVLGVQNAKFTPLTIADYRELNVGDDVYAIGSHKSMAYTITKGVISAKEREIGEYKYLQTDAAINEGNSGGPLLNKEGNVIGINTMKISDSEGIGLAIPMTVASDFLKSLGIKLDENGNVSERVVMEIKDEETAKPFDNNNNADTDNNQEETLKSPFAVTILLIAFCVSVSVNIVLIILLVFQKRRNLNLKYDPSERTEFDIDILE